MSAVGFVYFLSGFCGLVYETVWARSLTLSFGSGVAAQSVILAAFMCGLGFGGILGGRWAQSASSPLRWYGFIEILLGALAGLTTFFIYVFPSVWFGFFDSQFVDSFSFRFFRFFLSFVLVMIPTFLMGASFPFIARWAASYSGQIHRPISLFYALNTAGAVLGALSAGLFLIGGWGMVYSTALAVTLNVLIGLVSLVLAESAGPSTLHYPDEIAHQEPSTPATLSPFYGAALLSALFFSGAVVLALETLCSRILAVYLRNSTASFAVMLSLFLAGLTFGALIYSHVWKKRKFPVYYLGYFFALPAFYIFILASTAHFMPAALYSIRSLLLDPFNRFLLPPLVLSFIAFFIPVTLLGFIFPAAVSEYGAYTRKLGWGTGLGYGVNTLGSVVGALSAGFLLIPAFGLRNSLGIIVLICSAAAILITSALSPSRKRPILRFAPVALILMQIFAWTFFRPSHPFPVPPSIFRTDVREDKILFHEESSTGIVTVVEDMSNDVRNCFTDNSSVCGTSYDALKTVKLLGHLPAFLHPEPVSALVIGFGIGVTTSALAKHPLAEIDAVEIVEPIIEAAAYFEEHNDAVLTDPRLDVTIEDGRLFLAASDETYDIITCDPTHPNLGSGALYTIEFYRQAYRRLNDDGVFAEYLPFHKLTPHHLQSILKTFGEVFEDPMLWIGFSHGIMTGRKNSSGIDFRRMQSLLFKSEINQDLIDQNLNRVENILACFVFGEKSWVKFAEEGSIVSDLHPILDYAGPGSLSYGNFALNMQSLLQYRELPLPYLHNLPDNTRLYEITVDTIEQYSQDALKLWEGQIHHSAGRYSEELETYKTGLEQNPRNRELRQMLQAALEMINRADGL